MTFNHYQRQNERPLTATDNDAVALASANELKLIAMQAGELEPLTLTVTGGECVVIAGASGSGKSRLLRAIADLDPGIDTPVNVGVEPAAVLVPVRMTLGGVDHYQYSGAEWRRRVAYVAAESQWWFDDVARHFSIQPAAEQCQALGLNADSLKQPVSRLSSGERQRLALLRVLVQQPQVLLLDEPTASLDPVATIAVEQLIMAYCQGRQAAVIWVSHSVDQARRVGQRYFRIEQGRLLEQPHTPDQVTGI
jgi:ABC-type iron transport system FetAB ATPase subunit